MPHLAKPSPATVISLIALFVSLGGSGYAAVKINGKNIKSESISGSKLKNRTITGGKLKNRTITGGKVKRDTLTGTEINESKLGQVPSAQNATNATNLGGQPASSYAPATTLRTARVAANGTVDAAHSDGVSQGNVTQPVSGLYCFNGLSPAPRSVVASIAGGTATVQTQTQYAPTGGMCAGSQFDVATVNDANNLVPEAFTVFIH